MTARIVEAHHASTSEPLPNELVAAIREVARTLTDAWMLGAVIDHPGIVLVHVVGPRGSDGRQWQAHQPFNLAFVKDVDQPVLVTVLQRLVSKARDA